MCIRDSLITVHMMAGGDMIPCRSLTMNSQRSCLTIDEYKRQSYDRNSSYDPSKDTYSQWGANRDCDGYIRMEKDRLVAFEMEGPGAVSYTHLDVYKRQELLCLQQQTG